MLSLINCKIIVQFLKLYSFVSLTFATASSNALFAKSKALSTYPHLSQRNTDMFKCRLNLTSFVGGRLLLARVSAYSQQTEAFEKNFPSVSSTSHRYRQKSPRILRKNILCSTDFIWIFPDSIIFITYWHVFMSQFYILALQFLSAEVIYFVYLLPIFLLIALSTFSSALRLLTKFLYADAHRFLSALERVQSLISRRRLAYSAIYQYLQVC